MATLNMISHLSCLSGFLAASLIDIYHRQVIESISGADESIDGIYIDNAQVISNRLEFIRSKRKNPLTDACFLD